MNNQMLTEYQVLNIAFAICGILGAVYGIGQKLAYFEMRPDHFHKALLVYILASLECITANTQPVLVGWSSGLRGDLHYCQNLHHYLLATHYD